MATISPPVSTPPMMPPAMRRPTGVSILGVLGFIGAALFALVGLASFFAGAAIGSMMESVYGTEFGAMGGAIVGAAMGIAFLIAGAVMFAFGFGFWKGWTWLWYVAGILWALSALSSLLSIGREPVQSVITIAIDLFLIWYITQKGVQRWFKVNMNVPWAK